MLKFVAIDFETADPKPDSACALGLVRVEDSRIVARDYFLIRPPRPHIHFTTIHGITWTDVAGQPDFRNRWPRVAAMLEGVDFIAAHNAPFDRRVLFACCEAGGILPPELGFVCTVRLARNVLKIRPARLPVVCRRLGIPLAHHQPLSDAEACARIVMTALKDGSDPQA